ncbi:AraC family transcriptional regulator [Bacillus spongiae]|uniref:AraC family transcriptional regulator n=1 Tax=Bacillus spongiae TaxID=2683610 RepID=A0ABU8HC18_9BACI
MNILQRMNDCIDYIEENIHQEINLTIVAKKAYSSTYHFQRMFHMLTGYTVAEYIRKRRLTLAAQELTNTNTKVIDIAFKYRYDNPENFSRAFRKVHGIAPSQVRVSECTLVAFPRIHFHLSMTGEKQVNYQILKKEKFNVVGKGITVPIIKGDSRVYVNKFWEQIKDEGVAKELYHLTGETTLFGVIMDIDLHKEEFHYFIGVKTEYVYPKYDSREIPAARWAVFETNNSSTKDMEQVWERIYTEWFPSTGYEQHDHVPEIEVVSPSIDGCEIWIPLKMK